MWSEIGKPEFIGGIVSLIGVAVFVLKRLDLIHFGKPPICIAPACPDPGCKDTILKAIAMKADKSPETGGSLHIAQETRSKLALYRVSEMQDMKCDARYEQLKREFSQEVHEAVRDSETRIITAIKNGGR
jgi:hypothetical protein